MKLRHDNECDFVLMKSFLCLDFMIYASKLITNQKWLFVLYTHQM